MRRGGGKRRLVRRSGGSFRSLALVVALPAIALIGFFAWSWIRDPQAINRLTQRVASSDAATVVPPPAATDWYRVLDSAGVDRSAIQREGESLRVDFAGSSDQLLDQLRSSGVTARRLNDQRLEISSDDTSIAITVAPIATQDSGLGLVAAGEFTGTIVLILDDVGFERQPLERAAAIDPNIAFAVIPSASRAREASLWLGSRGYEILCHLPMEPEGWPSVRVDEPAILVGMNDEQIRSTTDALLRGVPGAVGVNNHMGSRASSDRRVMEAVMRVIDEHGLYFIDSRTSSTSVGASAAGEAGVRTASRHVFLDDDPSPDAVRRQLRELSARARRDGLSVGIGHVLPGTVAVLEQEIPRLRQAGIRIVRPSEIVR